MLISSEPVDDETVIMDPEAILHDPEIMVEEPPSHEAPVEEDCSLAVEKGPWVDLTGNLRV